MHFLDFKVPKCCITSQRKTLHYLFKVDYGVFCIFKIYVWKLNHQVHEVRVPFLPFIHHLDLPKSQSIQPINLDHVTITMSFTELKIGNIILFTDIKYYLRRGGWWKDDYWLLSHWQMSVKLMCFQNKEHLLITE